MNRYAWPTTPRSTKFTPLKIGDRVRFDSDDFPGETRYGIIIGDYDPSKPDGDARWDVKWDGYRGGNMPYKRMCRHE